ncbi:MAG: hypothetical protein FWD66_09345 [Paludibacter sp.]|nr:hypothetical protein [Paludibacter sp.]
MYKRKFILLSALVICTMAHGQNTFAPIGAEWYYNYNFHPFGYYNRIVSDIDSVVEESNCRVLRQYYDAANTIASKKYIIKQEQGRVYYYYQDRFNLLFDFDAQVNDIVEFTFMYRRFDDEFYISYTDTIISLRFEVESITTDAQNLKTFTTKVIDEFKPELYGDYGFRYSYTEKIGYEEQFMPMLDNKLVVTSLDEFLYLRCYSDSDLSYVSSYWETWGGHGYYPCDYSFTNGINELKNNNNIPFTKEGILFWENPEKLPVRITLYSFNGAKISEIYPVTDEYSLKNNMNIPVLYEIIIGDKRYAGKYIFN